MWWSYSASRSFRQCQRQWYFKNVVANSNARDPFRRRVYLLSKLQSISAWRGSIVDNVISKTLIPNLNRGVCVTLKQAKRFARGLFERQLIYARRHPISDLSLQVSKEGDEFAVFHAIEYEEKLPEHEIERAWCEVETALANLFALDEIKRILKLSNHIVPQRALQFALMDDVTVRATPDAIAFPSNGPLAIIDWKVHTFGTRDAWLQLAIYAIALSRCNPHRDFPNGFKTRPQEMALYEVQLLTKIVRQHSLAEEHIIEAEEYMLSSAYEIACLTEGKKYAELNVEDFRLASYAGTCQRCAFRAICWEESNVHCN